MNSAWAFYRRSTDKQELSIEDQRRECRAFAAARGWEIVREFEPAKGFGSGLTIDRDATFLEMVRLAEAGGHGVQFLIVYDVSRFGRLHQDDKIYWERRFKRDAKIGIVYVKGEIKNDGSFGDGLMKYVQHHEAHEYSRKLSEVTLRGSKSRAALGQSTGGLAPYGYDRLLIDGAGNAIRVLKRGEHAAEGQHVIWAPSPSESDTVRLIFDRYSQGVGLKRLTEEMNARRIPPPSSTRHHLQARHWSKSTIRDMLKNRVYVGDRVYNQTNCKSWRRGEGGPFRNPSSEWVIKENAHEPIIARDLFERVQAPFRHRVFATGRSYARPYLLTGLAKCQLCGYSLTGCIKDNYRRYTCSGYNRIGSSVCMNYFIFAEDLEKLAVDAVRTQIQSPAWAGIVKRTLESVVQGEFSEPLAGEIEERRQQLQEVNRQIENVVQAIQRMGFSESLELSLRSLESQRDALQNNLIEIEAKILAMSATDSIQDRIFSVVGDFDAMWARASLDEKKFALKKCLYGVTVKPTKEAFYVDYHVWTIPGIGQEIAQVPYFSREPGRLFTSQERSGGRTRPLLVPVPPEILPFVTTQSYLLRRQYGHRRASNGA